MHLARFGDWLEVRPGQCYDLADADPGRQQEMDQRSVPTPGDRGQKCSLRGRGKPAFGQPVRRRDNFQVSSGVDGEDASPVPKAEQALDAGECAGAACGRRLLLFQTAGEGIEVGQRHLAQWPTCEGAETSGVGVVGLHGLRRPSLQPQLDKPVVIDGRVKAVTDADRAR
jgi:hypothetical protein